LEEEGRPPSLWRAFVLRSYHIHVRNVNMLDRRVIMRMRTLLVPNDFPITKTHKPASSLQFYVLKYVVNGLMFSGYKSHPAYTYLTTSRGVSIIIYTKVWDTSSHRSASIMVVWDKTPCSLTATKYIMWHRKMM
jgi:hypothetical protein